METKQTLDQIIKELEEDNAKKQNFNLFRYMFNWHNERYLHSSFICMMISMNKDYLHFLLEEIFERSGSKNRECKKFFENGDCKIYPNKDDHSEKHNIDILIMSPDKTKAIIIENKTFAEDRFVGDEHQLISYGKALKKEPPQCKTIFYVYLTPRKYDPKNIEDFKGKILITVAYDNHIKSWIQKCFEKETDCFKKEVMRQYKEMLDLSLNNVDRTMMLKEIIGENLQEFEDIRNKLENKDVLKEEMKNVKWHIIYDFFQVLFEKMDKIEKLELSIDHRELQKSIDKVNQRSRAKLVFNFTYDKHSLYICNDIKGFTVGKCCNNKEYEILNKDKIVFTKLPDKDKDIQKLTEKKILELANKEKTEKVVNELIQGLDTYLCKFK